jgi:AcrR family transcriptional regulator
MYYYTLHTKDVNNFNRGLSTKMTEAVNRRPYRSATREDQAQRTRRAVLGAAHRLFLAGGFAATTVPAIAEAAGVSVQTVYKAFANKAGLAKAVFDVAMAGDDEQVTMLERSALRRVREEPDPRRMFGLYGRFISEVAPRHVPVQLVIRDAATTDPDARQVWDELQAERLRGMTMFARALHDAGHLRPGVSVNEARDVLWTYNSAELYELLVIGRGWSAARYGRWVAAALTAALLPAAPAGLEAPSGRP